jgi:hypothetical protein
VLRLIQIKYNNKPFTMKYLENELLGQEDVHIEESIHISVHNL